MQDLFIIESIEYTPEVFFNLLFDKDMNLQFQPPKIVSDSGFWVGEYLESMFLTHLQIFSSSGLKKY